MRKTNPVKPQNHWGAVQNKHFHKAERRERETGRGAEAVRARYVHIKVIASVIFAPKQLAMPHLEAAMPRTVRERWIN